MNNRTGRRWVLKVRDLEGERQMVCWQMILNGFGESKLSVRESVKEKAVLIKFP